MEKKTVFETMMREKGKKQALHPKNKQSESREMRG